FAMTGADGKATIADIPPGAYVLRVWHPQLNDGEEATRQTLSVFPGQTAAVNWKRWASARSGHTARARR
ncbi:MAG: carboxypeptidase-like regulatory domain-containing protein, partial [Betaproteobacteria bacterium]